LQNQSSADSSKCISVDGDIDAKCGRHPHPELQQLHGLHRGEASCAHDPTSNAFLNPAFLLHDKSPKHILQMLPQLPS
jgi:hypothetical protein